ncbi:MAG: helix-turn-helix domain-containing protein [Streptosporangiaceae bacterium]
MSIGEALAAARRDAGLTITQVSQRTCIRETIIRGIERGDYSACGGDFYTRGHIRSIARAVGVDPEPLVREYDATQGTPQAITAADIFEPSTPIKLKERRRPNWSLAMLVALVAVIGGGILYFVTNSPASPTANQVIAPAHPATKAVTPPAHAPVKPAATALQRRRLHEVVIHLTAASQDCWVELTSTAGTLIYQGTILPGDSRTWVEHQVVDLRLGNPGAVALTVNGKVTSPGAGTQPVTLSLGPALRTAG